MAASIQQDAGLSVPSSNEDERIEGQVADHVIPRFGYFGFVPDVKPRSTEDPLDLQIEDARVAEDPGRKESFIKVT
jgi:hypothetical protein